MWDGAGADELQLPLQRYEEPLSVSKEPRLALSFALLFAAMLLLGEWIGWRRIAVLWVLLFVGSLIFKLLRTTT